jgi:outer membrane receptor protein involved in Fe transport
VPFRSCVLLDCHKLYIFYLDFAVSRDFNVWPDAIWPSTKPLNLRFTVVNLLDTLYQLRSGTGIGEFAPQYGPRRGFYVTLSQKL